MAALAVKLIRGQIELARGRHVEALATLRGAERLAGRLAAPHPFVRPVRAWILRALILLGQTQLAGQTLAAMGERERGRGGIRIIAAILRLAEDDPRSALAELAPVVDGQRRPGRRTWLVEAFLLEAIAWDALGDAAAADEALERALEQAESGGALLWFLVHPAPELLERRARRHSQQSQHAQHAQHTSLVSDIRRLLDGREPAAAPAEPQEALRESEIRVLRYLPTNLTAPEIADELSVSRNTVKTHMRNLYTKLGTHRRTEAVARARELGLLAPSALHR